MKQSNPPQKQFDPFKPQNNNLFPQPQQTISTPIIKQDEKQNIEKELKDIKETQMKQQEYLNKILDSLQASNKAMAAQGTSLENKMMNYFTKLDNRLTNITNPSNNHSAIQSSWNNTAQNMNSMSFNQNSWNSSTGNWGKNANNLSQSAVFDSKNNANIFNEPNVFSKTLENVNTKLENGYNIKYITTNNIFDGKAYCNLEISNQFGKVETLKSLPMELFDLQNKKITDYVCIKESDCQILDPKWESHAFKLTTFNFMNMRHMSPSQKFELSAKVKEQAMKTGLKFNLDMQAGNLEIITGK